MADEINDKMNAPQLKTRFSDEELDEFKVIIKDMLDKARAEYDTLRKVVMHNGSNDIEDTTPSFKTVEDETYGICRVTGKLIPKERLRLVPHATLSVEGKELLAKRGKK